MIWIDEKRKVNESNFLHKNHTFIHTDSDSCYFVHWLSTVCSNDNWIWISGWDMCWWENIYHLCGRNMKWNFNKESVQVALSKSDKSLT